MTRIDDIKDDIKILILNKRCLSKDASISTLLFKYVEDLQNELDAKAKVTNSKRNKDYLNINNRNKHW